MSNNTKKNQSTYHQNFAYTHTSLSFIKIQSLPNFYYYERRKKKGGLKVHMLIDAHSQTPTFVKVSEAKYHAKKFIQYLSITPHSMIVFDKACNHYFLAF